MIDQKKSILIEIIRSAPKGAIFSIDSSSGFELLEHILPSIVASSYKILLEEQEEINKLREAILKHPVESLITHFTLRIDDRILLRSYDCLELIQIVNDFSKKIDLANYPDLEFSLANNL